MTRNLFLIIAFLGAFIVSNITYASDVGIKSFEEIASNFKSYSSKAVKGDAESQYVLGYIYRKTGNYKNAIKWYQKSADQKYPAAMYAMGNIYSKGMGTIKPSLRTAIKWYQKAAQKGHAKSQNNLASLYYYGNGVEQNFAEAIKWYYAAASQGYPKAQHSLGQMYEVGEGTKKDLRWAYVWYKFAANKGFVESRSAISRVSMTMSDNQRKQAETMYQQWAVQPWAKNIGNEYNNHSLD
ncbi:MAG: sel1 repeat family protein [Alphaproteobacteria bacterium]|nr:sel1 repeat family protein [Alphaproteobacteria bacterium]